MSFFMHCNTSLPFDSHAPGFATLYPGYLLPCGRGFSPDAFPDEASGLKPLSQNPSHIPEEFPLGDRNRHGSHPRQIEHQHFRVLPFADADRRLVLVKQRVARRQSASVDDDFTARNMHIGQPSFGYR